MRTILIFMIFSFSANSFASKINVRVISTENNIEIFKDYTPKYWGYELEIRQEQLKIMRWDEVYDNNSVKPPLLQNEIVIFLYNASDRGSFIAIKNFWRDNREKLSQAWPKAVIIELLPDNIDRQVPRKSGLKLADETQAIFFEYYTADKNSKYKMFQVITKIADLQNSDRQIW